MRGVEKSGEGGESRDRERQTEGEREKARRKKVVWVQAGGWRAEAAHGRSV